MQVGLNNGAISSSHFPVSRQNVSFRGLTSRNPVKEFAGNAGFTAISETVKLGIASAISGKFPPSPDAYIPTKVGLDAIGHFLIWHERPNPNFLNIFRIIFGNLR